MRICFDIGGTSIKYGIAYEEDGRIRFLKKEETPTEAKKIGGVGIEKKILEFAKMLTEQTSVDGVAISTAGMVDVTTGTILYANENIPGYTGRNLKTLIETELHLPCTVENDVNCAALGEAIYGAAKGAGSVLCVTVGTGIGGAVVLKGEVWHGISGSAGEIGYMPMDGRTLEELASTTAMIKNVLKRTGEMLNGRQIFDLAKKGNKDCVDAIETLCENLGKGIATGICLLNPEAVVLGGGIMAQKEYLQPLLHKTIQKYVKAVALEKSRIVFAELENDAGMAGAFAVFNRYYS